ncbi:hypothetical protein LJB89_00110 [Tyzzerella sp. OttesenSCG-928-J15]|nr:hypothetical protein [Ruminococcaceae bacterium OttesenSCG-928-L11]MDL2248086.1 hypothetical protein [Tyzzerella sp. OttesenSCG-928-J15]
MEQQSPARKQLVRDAKREALKRMEEAARTIKDYERVVKKWDQLDENRERREGRNEIGRPDEEMLHWTEGEDGEIRTELNTVIPRPLEHEWWRQHIQGNFLDTIFDCPFEMHELTSSPTISNLLKTLNVNQCEIMYYRVIRQYSPQRIAKLRGQSDRNIRKVYDKLIAGLRDTLNQWLSPRYDEGLPLTLRQRRFIERYRNGELTTGKTKAALDENSGE